jgi:hypothetical protein
MEHSLLSLVYSGVYSKTRGVAAASHLVQKHLVAFLTEYPSEVFHPRVRQHLRIPHGMHTCWCRSKFPTTSYFHTGPLACGRAGRKRGCQQAQQPQKIARSVNVVQLERQYPVIVEKSEHLPGTIGIVFHLRPKRTGDPGHTGSISKSLTTVFNRDKVGHAHSRSTQQVYSAQ